MNIPEKNNDRGASRVALCIGAALAAVILIVALMVLPGMQQAALADCPCQPGYPCWPECLSPPPTYTPTPTIRPTELNRMADPTATPQGGETWTLTMGCMLWPGAKYPYGPSTAGIADGPWGDRANRPPMREQHFMTWGPSTGITSCDRLDLIPEVWCVDEAYMRAMGGQIQYAIEDSLRDGGYLVSGPMAWFFMNEPEGWPDQCAGNKFDNGNTVLEDPEMAATQYISIVNWMWSLDWPTGAYLKPIPGGMIKLAEGGDGRPWWEDFVAQVRTEEPDDYMDYFYGVHLHGYPGGSVGTEECVSEDYMCMDLLAEEWDDWFYLINDTLDTNMSGTLHISEVGVVSSTCVSYLEKSAGQGGLGLDRWDPEGHEIVRDRFMTPLYWWFTDDDLWDTNFPTIPSNEGRYNSIFWYQAHDPPEPGTAYENFWCSSMITETSTDVYTYTALGWYWNETFAEGKTWAPFTEPPE